MDLQERCRRGGDRRTESEERGAAAAEEEEGLGMRNGRWWRAVETLADGEDDDSERDSINGGGDW